MVEDMHALLLHLRKVALTLELAQHEFLNVFTEAVASIVAMSLLAMSIQILDTE